jgi:hypothetical protein
MAEPTLIQVFGAGATQTSTEITILKADLAAVGLTASSTNSAESLLAAIVLTGKAYLTQANFDANTDQSITILPGFNSIVQRSDSAGNFTEYRQFQYQFNAHKLDNSALDPDDL